VTGPAGAIAALALEPTNPNALAPALQDQVNLKPDQSGAFTFLFDVPAESQADSIAISTLGQAQLHQIQRYTPPKADALTGRYAEVAPRNLKPLLSDPVMAALQEGENHQLDVQNRRGKLHVRMWTAAADGVAEPIADGLYNVTLTHFGDELKCKLRLAGDGGKDLLILYLADEPFHQLTFERRAAARR
jgi:hypothetical protein